MDLRQIRQFIAVAETLSFRKAAERLHMAQPPLSVAVRRMEEEFGGALFVRGRRGVKLTPLGEAILDDARQVVFHAEQLRQSAETALSGLSGSLRIGFIGSAIHSLLPRVIPLFRERYPQVVLQLHESSTSQILRDVESGVIDLGLIRYPIIEASSAIIDVVEHDTLVAALPQNNPLAQRRVLRLAECADEPFVAYSATAAPNLRGLVVLACQAAGFTPRIVQEAVQVQTLVSLVESGLGMALVPSSISVRYATDKVAFRRLEKIAGAHLSIAIAVAAHPETTVGTAVRFRQVLMEVAEGRTPVSGSIGS